MFAYDFKLAATSWSDMQLVSYKQVTQDASLPCEWNKVYFFVTEVGTGGLEDFLCCKCRAYHRLNIKGSLVLVAVGLVDCHKVLGHIYDLIHRCVLWCPDIEEILLHRGSMCCACATYNPPYVPLKKRLWLLL